MNSIVGVLCSAWCLISPNTIQMIPWETSRYSSSSLSGPRLCPRRLPGDCLICLGQRIWQQHDGFVDRVCCATTLLWPSRLNIPRTVSLMVPFELGFHEELLGDNKTNKTALKFVWMDIIGMSTWPASLHQLCTSREVRESHLTDPNSFPLTPHVWQTDCTVTQKLQEYGGGELVGGWRAET